MRLCSKQDCSNRSGKGYKCSVTVSECVGEYTESMLLEAGVSRRAVKELKELGIIKRVNYPALKDGACERLNETKQLD